MSDFDGLRRANAKRQREWDPSGRIDLGYRGNELAGEVGEACNVIKKLERERLGIRGSRDTIGHLAEELADVVICVDLIAMAADIDLGEAVRDKFNATSAKVGLATRMEPKSGDGEHVAAEIAALEGRLRAAQQAAASLREERDELKARLARSGNWWDAAADILAYVGCSQSPSREPGADYRRDWIASLVALGARGGEGAGASPAWNIVAAAGILAYLGRGQRLTLEPGADERRDWIAATIARAAQRRHSA